VSLDVPRHISTWVLPNSNSGSCGVEMDKKKALYSMSLQPWVESVHAHSTIWVVKRELLAIIVKQ